MMINSEDMVLRIYEEFPKVYKPFSKFLDSGDVWEAAIEVIFDEDLMEKIIFCNDVLKIPPVKVFMSVATGIQQELSNYEKKAIGAFWGFVFKNILNYNDQKSISIRINTIKSATYFSNDMEFVEIENAHYYKEYVDKQNISIEGDKIYRYLLQIPFILKNKNKTALVILKNPSKADKTVSDHTINNVLKYCKDHYDKVYIMNLFPCYFTNANYVNKFINSNEFDDRMQENIKVLDNTLNLVDDVIVAWGGDSIGNKKIYDKSINEVLQHIELANKSPLDIRLKENPVKRKYPWHAQVWAVNKGLKAFKWL